jgi:hypothetical protein
MRVFFATAVILGLMQAPPSNAQQMSPAAASQLVHEVVYNELHDHDRHGYWRYWIERHTPKETLLNEQIETADGPIARLSQTNGHPLDAVSREQEQERLNHLLASPSDQARHRQEYFDDEKRIGRILKLLPDAFLYEDAGEENGCRHLRFHPNPAYPARTIEARVFHAMSGELWVTARSKHLARLDGHLEENVDVGYGILGRLYKGGWFRLQRTQVNATDWKTERLEVHMNGRAMLFKTIARETSEFRGGFIPVPGGMNLSQGLTLLGQNSLTGSALPPVTMSVHR